MILSRLGAALLVLSVLFGERVQVSFGGGSLSPFGVAFVGVAAAMWLYDGKWKRPYRAVGLNTVGPLLALMFLLPLIGLAAGTANPPHLYLLLVPATILGALSLSRARLLHGLRIDHIGFVMILGHGLYGLGQALHRLDLIPSSLWAPMLAWDIESQQALSDAYIVVGRSTGLFVNANSFGVWSCLAIVFSVIALRGRRQAAGIVLGICGVVSSQSRTALLILLVLAVILAIRALRDAKVAGRVLMGSGVSALAVAIAALMGGLARLVEDDLVARVLSGLAVVSGGTGADANLARRVVSWQEAWDFSASYPFGTFGPPQILFGTLIDNQFVYLYLQGGVLLVVAYLVTLASPAVLARRRVPAASKLWLVSAVLFIASFAMAPLEAVGASMLGWLAAAHALGEPPLAGDSRGDADVVKRSFYARRLTP